MTRKRVAIAALALGLLVAWRLFAGGAGRGGPPPGAAEAALRADTYVVTASPVRDVVRTVGTLAANESVELVAELSRRLVSVSVTEGTLVEAGALLFKLDDADLRAELAELEARRRLAASTHQRQKQLLDFDQKALSQQAYEQSMSELESVAAEIDALRVTLAKTELRAPFRARAGLRHVSEGAWVTPETPLIGLQDTSRIKIDFSLPERHAAAVSVGQKFRFSVAARAAPVEGEILAIEPAIDAPTRSLRVRGIVENPDGLLLPGAFVTVEIPVEQQTAGVLVPSQALVPSVSGQAVYVLENGKAALREVEIGLRTSNEVEVRSGLAVGDTVLTSNLLRLRPGVPVEPSGTATAGS
jgi:membrane fusion protein (multidrug efflux system)